MARPKKYENAKKITFRIPEETIEFIKAAAEKAGCSLNEFIIDIVKKHVE